jgi:UDP-N-acetylglucosamine/UDP-N-acetylgalactosamine diphosphorylase
VKIINSGSGERRSRGRRLVREGKLGCLLLAGGQGTRLRFDGPKGLFPITASGKTLFQLFREGREAAGDDLPLAILVSAENEAAGREAVPEADICVQDSLPLLDDNGETFLSAPGQTAVGPNGNGSALRCFVESGLWAQWRERGVKYLNIAMVDNPLGDPYDAEMVALLEESGADAVVKTTRRRNAQEKVGVLVAEGDRVRVIEYSELDDPSGYKWANLSLFTFTMDFVRKVAEKELPYHRAHKAVPIWKGNEIVWPKEPNAWKREQFIFDVLPYAERVEVIAYPREECFAPLKNAEGDDSPETVRAALQARDHAI